MGLTTNLQNFRWPSNEVAMGQRSSANDMPDFAVGDSLRYNFLCTLKEG